MTNTTELIQTLKTEYDHEPRNFEFIASIYISGDCNKPVRQAIIKQITGEQKPVSKCNFTAVVNELQNHFNQFNLF